MCTYEYTLFGSVSSTCFTGEVIHNVYDPLAPGSIVLEIIFFVILSYILQKRYCKTTLKEVGE